LSDLYGQRAGQRLVAAEGHVQHVAGTITTGASCRSVVSNGANVAGLNETSIPSSERRRGEKGGVGSRWSPGSSSNGQWAIDKQLPIVAVDADESDGALLRLDPSFTRASTSFRSVAAWGPLGIQAMTHSGRLMPMSAAHESR